jgi:hypothetical protein
VTAVGGVSGQASIQVSPAAVARFVGGTQLEPMLWSAGAATRAGSVISVVVTVQDACGNVVPGYTGTVAFSSSDAQATLPPNYTFTAGATVHESRVTAVQARTRGCW